MQLSHTKTAWKLFLCGRDKMITKTEYFLLEFHKGTSVLINIIFTSPPPPPKHTNHTHLRAPMHSRTRTQAHAHRHTHARTHAHTHTHTHTHMHVCASMHYCSADIHKLFNPINEKSSSSSLPQDQQVLGEHLLVQQGKLSFPPKLQQERPLLETHWLAQLTRLNVLVMQLCQELVGPCEGDKTCAQMCGNQWRTKMEPALAAHCCWECFRLEIEESDHWRICNHQWKSEVTGERRERGRYKFGKLKSMEFIIIFSYFSPTKLEELAAGSGEKNTVQPCRGIEPRALCLTILSSIQFF